jgi:hypothetical protein
MMFCGPLKVISLWPQVLSGILIVTCILSWADKGKVEGEVVTLEGEVLVVQVRVPELETFLRVTLQVQPLPLK